MMISKAPPSSDNRSSKKPHVPRMPFPHMLYEMLKTVEKNGQTEIVSWQPHGRCFLVHKPEKFIKDIMPKLFRQTKYSSFQRQLNLYGFQRLSTGADKGGYYHEYFLRGSPLLLDSITRTRVKGTGVRKRTDVRLEPNFYSMVPLDSTFQTFENQWYLPPKYIVRDTQQETMQLKANNKMEQPSLTSIVSSAGFELINEAKDEVDTPSLDVYDVPQQEESKNIFQEIPSFDVSYQKESENVSLDVSYQKELENVSQDSQLVLDLESLDPISLEEDSCSFSDDEILSEDFAELFQFYSFLEPNTKTSVTA